MRLIILITFNIFYLSAITTNFSEIVKLFSSKEYTAGMEKLNPIISNEVTNIKAIYIRMFAYSLMKQYDKRYLDLVTLTNLFVNSPSNEFLSFKADTYRTLGVDYDEKSDYNVSLALFSNAIFYDRYKSEYYFDASIPSFNLKLSNLTVYFLSNSIELNKLEGKYYAFILQRCLPILSSNMQILYYQRLLAIKEFIDPNKIDVKELFDLPSFKEYAASPGVEGFYECSITKNGKKHRTSNPIIKPGYEIDLFDINDEFVFLQDDFGLLNKKAGEKINKKVKIISIDIFHFFIDRDHDDLHFYLKVKY